MGHNCINLLSFVLFISLCQSACIIKSDDYTGLWNPREEELSNQSEIEALGVGDYTLYSLTVCEKNDKVVGHQYTLVNKSDDSDIVELSAMGRMRGDCQTLILQGPIDKVRASFKDEDDSVSAIKYFRGRTSKQWGRASRDYQEYVFSAEQPVIGLWGRASSQKITQLGFLTISEDPNICPEPEPVDETEEPTEPEEVVEEVEEEIVEPEVVIELAPLPIVSPPMIPIPISSTEIVDPATIIPEVIAEEISVEEVKIDQAPKYQYEMRSLRSYYVWSGIIILLCMMPSLLYLGKE